MMNKTADVIEKICNRLSLIGYKVTSPKTISSADSCIVFLFALRFEIEPFECQQKFEFRCKTDEEFIDWLDKIQRTIHNAVIFLIISSAKSSLTVFE